MFYCQISLANKAIDNEAGRWDHFLGFSRSICQLRLRANSLVRGKNERAEPEESASLGYQTSVLTYDSLKFSILWSDLEEQIIFPLIWQRWNFLKLHNIGSKTGASCKPVNHDTYIEQNSPSMYVFCFI